ncbi:MAG: methylenetetrahydrofolate reductase [Actinobacteria bacterium]|nr:methylenetetrahydrofolate reductase [Actinomycetota bacterium]
MNQQNGLEPRKSLLPRPTISFEFFPPKDELGESNLHLTIEALKKFNPDFVTLTYGAGGSTRDRTVRIAAEIIARHQIPTMAHLTCVGSTRKELTEILHDYSKVGVKDLLALRGDPTGGPTSEWISTPGGLDFADQLVDLAAKMGGFNVGVAAFPDIHPASHGNFQQDIEVLLRKEELGATFAITQFVFDSERYAQLLFTLRDRGSKLTLYPGIMPVTNYMQIVRMLELSGGTMPSATRLKFARYQNDPASIKELGVEVAARICEEVFEVGAEGFHFYTLNSAVTTSQVVSRLSMLNFSS